MIVEARIEDRASDPTGWVAEIQALRLDDDRIWAERECGEAPTPTWALDPWSSARGEGFALREVLLLAEEDLLSLRGEAGRRGALALREARLAAAESVLAPPRGLLGPDRGFPRAAVLHLLLDFPLQTLANLRAWVARVEDLPRALSLAPTVELQQPLASTQALWAALVSPALGEALVEHFETHSSLLPQLSSSERGVLRQRLEVAVRGPLKEALETLQAASIASDRNLTSAQGLSHLPGGLALYGDRLRLFGLTNRRTRTLAEVISRLEQQALTLLGPDIDLGSAGARIRALDLVQTVDPAETFAAEQLQRIGLTKWPFPSAQRTLLPEAISPLLGGGRVRAISPSALRLTTGAGTAGALDEARLGLATLKEAMLLHAKGSAPRSASSQAAWPGWAEGLALATILLLEEEHPDWRRGALLLEALALARADLGLHQARWDQERALASLEAGAGLVDSARCVDRILDEPGRALLPVACLDLLLRVQEDQRLRPEELLERVISLGPLPLDELESRLLGE